MALRCSRASGNFSAAATWGTCDATFQAFGAGDNVFVPTTPNTSASSRRATGGGLSAGTYDAIAVRLNAVNAAPSGTFTIQLVETTGGTVVSGTTVTVNVADLPAAISADGSGGFLVFKFASPVTLAGATNYAIDCSTSVANMVSLWRQTAALGGDWERFIRSTTQAAPAAGDKLVVAGEFTGAGTSNSYTVTMDNNSTTAFGGQPASASALTDPALDICAKGTLSFSRAASTQLRINGNVMVRRGGTLDMGTIASPIPRAFNAILEFGQAASPLDGDYGLCVRDGATWTAQGQSRTSGKNVDRCLLNVDVAASAVAPSTSTLGVDTDTGWLSGDMIAIASTSRTLGDCEAATLTANAGASSMTIANCTAAVVNQAIPLTSNRGCLVAHSGTAPFQAEVILLTRNVKIRSTSNTVMTYVKIGLTAVQAKTVQVDVGWTEFYFIGVNAADKRGLDIDNGATGGTSTINVYRCSFHDTENAGITLGSAAGSTLDGVTIQNNLFWAVGMSAAAAIQVFTAFSAPGTYTVDGNVSIRCGGSTTFLLNDLNGIITNNKAIGGAGAGFGLNQPNGTIKQFDNNEAHANSSGAGIIAQQICTGVINNPKVWRNSSGLTPNSGTGLTVNNPNIYGNTLNVSAGSCEVAFSGGAISGDTGFASTSNIAASGLARMTFDSVDLSGVGTGLAPASTQDVLVSILLSTPDIVFRNCKFGAPAFLNVTGSLVGNARIASQRHNQVNGDHRTYRANGRLQTDTTIFKTASPSERITPSSATKKMQSGSKFVAVAAGGVVLVGVYVRKSVVGDGAAYNGNAPRLIQKQNGAIGLTADTVQGTLSGGAGAFAQIMATITNSSADDGVVEVCVDCDGTAGWINVDDWSVA